MSEALVLLVVLGFWIAVITLAAIVMRLRRGRPTPRDVELDKLKARYALGEVSREDYDRRCQELALPDAGTRRADEGRHRTRA
jgi:uncharacterized membrane protein